MSLTPDETVVMAANHARGDSLRTSARILRRRETAVRCAEIRAGLFRDYGNGRPGTWRGRRQPPEVVARRLAGRTAADTARAAGP